MPVTPASSAEDVVAALAAAGQSVATAESLTGGLIIATLVDVPGASAVVRGGIVAYHPQLKATLVGVDPGVSSPQHPDAEAGCAHGVPGGGGVEPSGRDAGVRQLVDDVARAREILAAGPAGG